MTRLNPKTKEEREQEEELLKNSKQTEPVTNSMIGSMAKAVSNGDEEYNVGSSNNNDKDYNVGSSNNNDKGYNFGSGILSHDIEIPGNARIAVLEVLAAVAPDYLSRKQIIEIVGQHNIHSNNYYKNTQKKLWEVLTDWAISNLASKNKILGDKKGNYKVGLGVKIPTVTIPVQKTTNPSTQPTVAPATPVVEDEKDEEEPKPIKTPQKQKTVEEEIPQLIPFTVGTKGKFQTQISIPYYPDPDLQHMLNSRLYNKNEPMLILEGPAGVGKTMGVDAFAKINKLELKRLQAGPGTNETDLIGQFLLKPSADGKTETYFQEGILPQAINAANKNGSAVLLIDEINALRPEYQKYLNSLTGREKAAFGPGGTSWKLNPDANLVVISTMNPSSYGGVNMLNEELKGRAGVYYINYPKKEMEMKILSHYSPDKEVIKKLILLAQHTREMHNEEESFYPISPRDEGDVLTSYEGMKEMNIPEKEALRLALTQYILGKYLENPEASADVEAIKNKIKGIFDIDVKSNKE